MFDGFFNTNINTGIQTGGFINNGVIISYTIEDHLKSFRDSEQYKILYECWELEKKEYENHLKVVGMRYQTYSLHDATHSEAILKQIAYFLGEDRIRQLSPTDTWLLLESAYCHDLGMAVTAKELADVFSDMAQEEFEQLSKRMYNSDNQDIKMAWSYLEPLFRYGKKIRKLKDSEEWEMKLEDSAENYKVSANLVSIFDSEWYEWPMHFTQAFMMLIQEWCRPRHATMSFNKIAKEADEKTYEGLIPLRLRYLIADIAAIHTDDKKNVIKKLSRVIQGYVDDYAHPRFVAELIRVGDLLDMDNNRFNKYQLAVAGNPSYNSFAHQLKHKALRDFLITPKAIEVCANFDVKSAEDMLSDNLLEDVLEIPADKVIDPDKLNEKAIELCLRAFKEMAGWLKMLREELEFFSVNWLKIIPDNFTGSCPVFDREMLKIDGSDIDPDLLDLRYHITARRASEIIEGSGLYEDTFTAFVRELIQNSMDAVKRKMAFKIYEQNIECSDNPLDFYRYLSNNLDQISIILQCQEKGNGDVEFVIRDKGIGITYECLKNMQHIGATFDYKMTRQAEKMPLWWKPTGSYGIGMQTIFYFTKQFEVKTRTEQEGILRKMYFHSTQIGGKIDTYFINDDKKAKEFGYGTQITICIPRSIMQLFNEKSKIGENGDYFGNEATVYKNRIDKTIKKVRGSFGIPVNLESNKSKKDKNVKLSEKENEISIPYSQKVSEFLLRCFGKYFIDISKDVKRNHKVTQVINESVEVTDYNLDGFSCWNADEQVLIRYRWPKKDQNETSLKIYFNEILVDDHELHEMVNINFLETEVYLFNNNAQNFLEINRDGFLYEKRGYIANAICRTHLECLKYLLTESEADGNNNETSEADIKREIWGENHDMIKQYFNFLINGGNIAVSNIGINMLVQNNGMLRYLNYDDVRSLTEHKMEVNTWLLNSRYKFLDNAHLLKHDSGVRFIVEDILYNYTDIAVSKIECLQTIYKEYIVIYKTTERSGMPIRISQPSFESYIHNQYENMKDNSNTERRMILPGYNDYKVLCVYKLIDNLGTTFEKRFNSAIIFPFNINVLDEILDMDKETEVETFIRRKLIENKSSDSGDGSYTKILNYIKKYRLNKGISFDEDEIMNSYVSLIIYVWKVLKN